jgi:hypothetical protein
MPRTIVKFKELKDPAVLLFTVKRETPDLNSSFLRRRGKRIVGMLEKPETLDDETVDYSEAMAGLYTFSKGSMFLEMFDEVKREYLEKDRLAEIFISHVIDKLICNNKSLTLETRRLNRFVSLGSNELIERALKENSLGISFKEAGTLFIDLDGTILEHDNGGGLGKFNYSELWKLSNESIVPLIKELHDFGYSIIVTTSRKFLSNEIIKIQLENMGIPVDGVIEGLPGGPRILLNDVKPSVPCLMTSFAINLARNEFPLEALSHLTESTREAIVIREFIGESGEQTFLIKDAFGLSVRKCSLDNENSRNLIKYQHNWFQIVSELLPELIPNLGKTNVYSEDSIIFFDTNYISNLQTFADYLKSQSQKNGQRQLSKLVDCFVLLYEKYQRKSDKNMFYLNDVIEKKAQIGLNKGIKFLASNYEGKEIFVHGKSLSRLQQKWSGIFVERQETIRRLMTDSKSIDTLIHGDPTLSNIMMQESGMPVFLDPIGSRVLPDFNFAQRGLGRTHPIFDFSRIRLSLQDEYESWRNDLYISDFENYVEVSFHPSFRISHLYKHFQGCWPSELMPKEEAVSDLVYILTLARILPYKLKNKRAEALYLMGLISELCDKFQESHL